MPHLRQQSTVAHAYLKKKQFVYGVGKSVRGIRLSLLVQQTHRQNFCSRMYRSSDKMKNYFAV